VVEFGDVTLPPRDPFRRAHLWDQSSIQQRQRFPTAHATALCHKDTNTDLTKNLDLCGVADEVLLIGALVTIVFLLMLHMDLLPQILFGGITAIFLGVMIFLILRWIIHCRGPPGVDASRAPEV
jgi:hypothetical protein